MPARPPAHGKRCAISSFCDNYIDAVDRGAEYFAPRYRQRPKLRDTQARPIRRRGSQVAFDEDGRPAPLMDPASGVAACLLPAPRRQRKRSDALQVALVRQNDPCLKRHWNFARFKQPCWPVTSRKWVGELFCRGRIDCPCGRFLETLKAVRHDLEVLATPFGPRSNRSRHRLSTLQRPGSKGFRSSLCAWIKPQRCTQTPISATRLQFAAFSAELCPYGMVHSAFEERPPFSAPAAENGMGCAYISFGARLIEPAWGGFWRTGPAYAISLGSSPPRAPRWSMADEMDTTRASAFETDSVFPAASLAKRKHCHQRPVPRWNVSWWVDPKPARRAALSGRSNCCYRVRPAILRTCFAAAVQNQMFALIGVRNQRCGHKSRWPGVMEYPRALLLTLLLISQPPGPAERRRALSLFRRRAKDIRALRFNRRVTPRRACFGSRFRVLTNRGL